MQNLKTGETSICNVPSPQPLEGHVTIQTTRSLVSVGTERMLVEFGKAGWIDKARSQPDKVKEVIEKIKVDGFSATYEAVKSKLDQPLPLGYCNVGRLLDGGNTGFEEGARVVSNGHHAEVVRVPKNLVARIPDEVDDETAAFTVLGAIALQGIRLADPSIGETVVVTGLGIIGLLTIQLLKANGCRVIGIDVDSAKCRLAEEFKAEVIDLSQGVDPISQANIYSRGRGVDAVIVTASSQSNEIMHQAAQMCKKRGRIVLVGVVGLDLIRDDFYEKELTFQVSCSYGPGRYDEEYEDKGVDYPFGFVRWTEQRNFEAVLDLMASGAIDVKPLITHRFEIDEAVAAYESLDDRSSLGILLKYKDLDASLLAEQRVQLKPPLIGSPLKGGIAVIGAGNYASRVLIPCFKNAGANLIALVTSGGVSAVHHGGSNGFLTASTDIEDALDDAVYAVVVATRHHLHASQVVQALRVGKHVFVEKPLALTHEEIDEIEEALSASQSMLMVGYNRRFSPHVQKMKKLLSAKTCPKVFVMTMNAGEVPKEHWTQDAETGGGRIIGEACHYIDLMRFLASSPIKSVNAIKIGPHETMDVAEDKAIISLVFEDGSIGSIHYLANGGKAFPKERVEVFCDGAVLQLDNFKKMRGFGWRQFKTMDLWSQDKGQQSCVDAFMKSVTDGGIAPISSEEIFEVARTTIDVAEMLRT